MITLVTIISIMIIILVTIIIIMIIIVRDELILVFSCRLKKERKID